MKPKYSVQIFLLMTIFMTLYGLDRGIYPDKFIYLLLFALEIVAFGLISLMNYTLEVENGK